LFFCRGAFEILGRESAGEVDGVEEFKLAPKKDSLMRNYQGKNHTFVK
jgi:hypothetical protein